MIVINVSSVSIPSLLLLPMAISFSPFSSRFSVLIYPPTLYKRTLSPSSHFNHHSSFWSLYSQTCYIYIQYIHTTFCEKCSTKRDACDWNEIYIVGWVQNCTWFLWLWDFNMVWSLHALQWEPLSVVAKNQREPGETLSTSLYVSSQSVKISCWSMIRTNCQPTISLTCLVNAQAREAVIRIILLRLLAQFPSHVAGHFPTEIWNVELPEGGAISLTLKPP